MKARLDRSRSLRYENSCNFSPSSFSRLVEMSLISSKSLDWHWSTRGISASVEMYVVPYVRAFGLG